MARFAPCNITWAIAHYVSPDPAEMLGQDHYNSGTGNEMLKWLLSEGLIDANGKSNARLEAWIDHLCAQPLPEMVWIVPTKPPTEEDADA